MLVQVDDEIDFFDYLGQTEWNKAIQRSLMHWIGTQDADVVLDAGCGAGWLGMQFAPRVEQVTCMDISQVMLERAKRNAARHRIENIQYLCGDIYQIPVADEHYSLVLCMNVMFLLNNMEGAVAELLRVCRKGGQIVFFNPAPTLNAQTAQTYCTTQELHGFEHSSLISWAMASEFATAETKNRWQGLISALNAHTLDTLTVTQESVFDGMAIITKIYRG